jgi:hypothetical protein
VTYTEVDVSATTREGRECIRDRIKEYADDREHDPWGSGMVALGVLVDVLWSCGEGVPYWISTPGAAGGGILFPHADVDGPDAPDDEHVEARRLYQQVCRGELTIDDVRYGMFIVDRYLSLVELAGRSY